MASNRDDLALILSTADRDDLRQPLYTIAREQGVPVLDLIDAVQQAIDAAGCRGMTETLLALVPEWGAVLLALVNVLACLALPVPASLVMLAAGAFAAAGDLDALPLWIGAMAGPFWAISRDTGSAGALARVLWCVCRAAAAAPPWSAAPWPGWTSAACPRSFCRAG